MKLRRVPHIPTTVRDVTCLADGRLAYTVTNDDGLPHDRLYITDLTGHQISRYATDIKGGIAASPTDPDKIFIVGENSIYMWSLAAASRRQWLLLTTPHRFPIKSQAREGNHLIAWSHDGRHVAVVGQPVYRDHLATGECLFFFDLRLRLVTSLKSEAPFQHVAWMPSDTAVSYCTEGSNQTRFFSIRGYDNSPFDNLTKLEFNPRPETLHYTAVQQLEDGKNALVLQHVNKFSFMLELHDPASGEVGCQWSRWSRDGNKVIYNSAEANAIMVYNASTFEVELVARDNLSFDKAVPVWSPDSQHCLLVTPDEGVFVVEMPRTNDHF